jgi:tRNA A-37 threonylcarbamoyl transferase component Bud32/dipeptidyl aminopeptidase/acylaminoacyl peptidase
MLHLLHLARTERDKARTHAREHKALPRRHVERTQVSTSPRAARGTLPPLEAGQELGGRYRVIGLLGEGGMGAVYRVHDRVLDEEVALKLVHGDNEDLRDEVRLAQQVAHRNVCRTYDLEEIGGYHFVKMEYISGVSLADQLARGGALPVARAVAIARAIADGLAAAHARGIVHRDLKPANVMLEGERVVLCDFGLAQREGASELAGTPAYMSPEQLAGGAIDTRSDLFGLGCVVFEMLAGTSPFGWGTIEDQIRKQRALGVPDVRDMRPDVPRALAAAVGALLAPDPAARAQGLTLLRVRPRRARFVAAALALALIAAGATAWAMRPARAWEPTLAELPQYEENADEPSFSPDGKSFVFSSDRGRRDVWAVYVAAVGDGEPSQVSPPGVFCLDARWERSGKAILMSCFVGQERRILRQPLPSGASTDLGPGWSVDDCGDALAVIVARPNGSALVMRDRDGHDTDLASLPALTSVRCDRSGQRLAYLLGPIGHIGDGGDIVVVDRHGGSRTLAGVHDAQYPTFTPDGTSIVFAMQQGLRSSLFEIPVEGGAIRELTPHERDAKAPDIASDGKTLIYDRDRTSSALFELGAGGPVQRTFHFEWLSHILPAGPLLVATKTEGHALSVVTIDPHDFSEHVVEHGNGQALAVTRAGEVVFRTNENPNVLHAVSLDGKTTRTVAKLAADVLDAADGPDGLHVELGRDGASEAWRIESDGTPVPEGVPGLVIPAPAGGWRIVRDVAGVEVTLRFIPPGRPLSEVAFERKGAWGAAIWVDAHQLAYCDLTACHRLDVVTGKDLETTPIERPGNHEVTPSSDGEHWYTTVYIGHVTRHLVTNFAERPWSP